MMIAKETIAFVAGVMPINVGWVELFGGVVHLVEGDKFVFAGVEKRAAGFDVLQTLNLPTLYKDVAPQAKE